MSKAKVKVIEEKTFNGSQSREYKFIALLTKNEKSFKVLIEIDRDSYDKQSSAVGRVWSEAALKWEFVYSIPYNDMRTLTAVSAYGSGVTVRSFIEDKTTILKQLEAVLFL
jgi:hypothetical protein